MSFPIIAIFSHPLYKGVTAQKMGVRENFQKLIGKKEQEVAELELRIRETRAYIQALEDSMKLLPRDMNVEIDHTLRPDSALAKARDAIRGAGSPLPISDILKALGKPPDKKNRVSLAGTLSNYARKGKVFTKTAPNTFGLVEFARTAPAATSSDSELPEEFGSME